MRLLTRFALLFSLALAPISALAEQPVIDSQIVDGYQLDTVADGLDFPWCVAFLPNGDLLVTQRSGALVRVDGAGKKHVITGMPEVYHARQGGLFDVMVSPDFAATGIVYLSYAAGTPGANQTSVFKARLQDDALVDGDVIFAASPTKATAVHYGGRMVTLPDGSIVLTLGDGFRYREEAQKLSSHIGTIVRFMPDGSAPADNPYIGRKDALPEIFSYGHRSVQGLVHDAQTGTLWAHEHGAQGGDELNLLVPGGNYGWPLATTGIDYTGAKITPFKQYPGTEKFAHDWVPSIAPSGMVRYRGTLMPELDGDFLIGGLASMDVRLLETAGNEVTSEHVLFEELEERIRDLRIGPDGAIYLLTDTDEGRVIRISPAP